ncbi:MAG: cation:dicarboxylase symporter family transporter [Bacteroidia bacterium]
MNPFGDIFINLLKLIAVPLVLFSVITGIVSLQDIKKLGKIGLKTHRVFIYSPLCLVSRSLDCESYQAR